MGIFKKCNKCGFPWPSRDAFLKDPSVKTIGYQVFFEDLTDGMVLFNHSCGTTIAIHSSYFLSLFKGPFNSERDPDDRDCPRRCLTENYISPCSSNCKCSFISRLLEILETYPN